MVDPALNKVLPGCHKSGVGNAGGDCIGGRHLVDVVARHGTSTGKVFSFATFKALPIRGVLNWPLNSLLPLSILTSWVVRLLVCKVLGALDELSL
jgi:hypothetical protein